MCISTRRIRFFNGSGMGDNCIKFYLEIAQKRDISLFYEHYPAILEEVFPTGLIKSCDGTILYDVYDFDDRYSDWVGLRYG